MTPLFPDVEKVIVRLLEPFVATPDHVGTETPAQLQQMLPFLRVTRTGGPDDGITDQATISLDVFADTSAGKRLAAEIRTWLTSRWRRTPEGVVVDRVITEAGPHELPWGDPNIRMVTTTYTVHVRRVSA